MEEENPKSSLEDTSTAQETDVNPQTSPEVNLETDNKEKPKLQLENPKLASLSLKLPQEDCMKLARLKVRCLVAEGRLPPGGYQLMTENYSKQVELCWYSRKIQRINTLYRLHKLMRLKLEVTKELNAFTNRTEWVRKVLEFRGHIVNRITIEHRKLIFLSQFIDKKEFIKENREVSDLVVGMRAPIWQDYLRLSDDACAGKNQKKKTSVQNDGAKPKRGRPPKNSEAQKYDNEKVLDDLLRTSVSGSEQNATGKDLDGVQSGVSISLEESSKEVREKKERKTIHITEKKLDTISAQSSNDQAGLPQKDYLHPSGDACTGKKQKKKISVQNDGAKRKRGRPPKNSEAQKYHNEKVLDDMLKPLVSSSEQNVAGEDLDGVQSGVSKNLEEPSKEDREEKERKTIHMTEKKPDTISAQSSNDQTTLPQSIMNQPVQTVQLQELARRQENQVAVYSTLNPVNQVFPGGLVQYYKRLCPFIARSGSHFKSIQPRKHFLAIVGKPISTSLTEVIQDKTVISVTPNVLQNMKSRMTNILTNEQNKAGMAKRGRPKRPVSVSKLIQSTNNRCSISQLDKTIEAVIKDSIDGKNMSDPQKLLTTESQEGTTGDETQKTIMEKGSKPMSTRKRRLKNKEKTIPVRFEQQLKRLCLTRKCVVRLERMKNYCQYEST